MCKEDFCNSCQKNRHLITFLDIITWFLVSIPKNVNMFTNSENTSKFEYNDQRLPPSPKLFNTKLIDHLIKNIPVVPDSRIELCYNPTPYICGILRYNLNKVRDLIVPLPGDTEVSKLFGVFSLMFNILGRDNYY